MGAFEEEENGLEDLEQLVEEELSRNHSEQSDSEIASNLSTNS